MSTSYAAQADGGAGDATAAGMTAHPVDDDLSFTPVAGFDLAAYARDAMSTLDRDTTKLCPELDLAKLRAEAARATSVSLPSHAAPRTRAVVRSAVNRVALVLLPLLAVGALAFLLFAAIKTP